MANSSRISVLMIVCAVAALALGGFFAFAFRAWSLTGFFFAIAIAAGGIASLFWPTEKSRYP
jgi:hypothetical protein